MEDCWERERERNKSNLLLTTPDLRRQHVNGRPMGHAPTRRRRQKRILHTRIPRDQWRTLQESLSRIRKSSPPPLHTKNQKKNPPKKPIIPNKKKQFSLASCKAAQYNLLHSLHKEYGPKGVHCAALVVEGKVSEEAQVTTPKNIALEAWKLFEEPAPGELDATIQDPDYLEWVKKVEG